MSLTALLGVIRTSVNAWVANYLADGLNGLLDKPKPGRPNQLSPHQLEQLKKFIEKNAIKQDGGRLMAEDIRVYICNDLHVSYSLANVYRLLHALDFSLIQGHLPLSALMCGSKTKPDLANKTKRQDFGQNGVAVPVSSNSSNLIMGICLGQCARVAVKRKH